MKTRNVVINMECDGEASWVNPLVEVWPNQSVDWITHPLYREELPNIYWLIALFTIIEKNDERQYPGIKSWAQTVKELMNLFKKSCNLKGSLVFCP